MGFNAGFKGLKCTDPQNPTLAALCNFEKNVYKSRTWGTYPFKETSRLYWLFRRTKTEEEMEGPVSFWGYKEQEST